MRKSKYTKELLEPIVKTNVSVSGVLAALGLKNTGGNYRNIQAKIKYHNISMVHFTGMAWNKGKTVETDSRIVRTGYTDEQVFTNPSPLTYGQKLRPRMLRNGWEYKCSECGISEWNNKPLPLDIDHIDGNHTNNCKENLRFLCPNCHKQTETWGNKKHNKSRV